MAKLKSYSIASKPNSFWRCGREWTKSPVIVSYDEFNGEQWERLQNEAMLVIKPVDEVAPTEAVNEDVGNIFNAMLSDDPDKQNPDWWTNTGEPEIKELKNRGLKVNAKKRDDLWAAYLENE